MTDMGTVRKYEDTHFITKIFDLKTSELVDELMDAYTIISLSNYSILYQVSKYGSLRTSSYLKKLNKITY